MSQRNTISRQRQPPTISNKSQFQQYNSKLQVPTSSQNFNRNNKLQPSISSQYN